MFPRNENATDSMIKSLFFSADSELDQQQTSARFRAERQIQRLKQDVDSYKQHRGIPVDSNARVTERVDVVLESECERRVKEMNDEHSQLDMEYTAKLQQGIVKLHAGSIDGRPLLFLA